jgi:hypothetical protein
MAQFTDTQKTLIKANLGYSNLDSLGEQSTSVIILNNFLNREFDVSFINEVQSQLTKLGLIETELDNIISSSKISKADVVEFNVKDGASYVYTRGSNLVKYLGALCGVKVQYNKYNADSKSVSKLSY